MSTVSSHGMDGWSQETQASRSASGDRRGAATKSGPVTSTSGSLGARASRRTISLTTSVAGAPSRGWCSRTQTSHVPSGATSPSAKRSPRGTVGSGVRTTGSAPGAYRRRRWSAQSTAKTVPSCSHHAPPPYSWTAGAGVGVRGQQVGHRAVGVPAHQLDPPALAGAPLAPHDAAAPVGAHAVEPHPRGDDELRGDRCRPGSVGQRGHAVTVGRHDRRKNTDTGCQRRAVADTETALSRGRAARSSGSCPSTSWAARRRRCASAP